jgi:hypothetical protein
MRAGSPLTRFVRWRAGYVAVGRIATAAILAFFLAGHLWARKRLAVATSVWDGSAVSPSVASFA